MDCAGFGLKVIFVMIVAETADMDDDFHFSIRDDPELEEQDRLNLSLNPVTLTWSAPDYAVHLYSFLF